MESTIAEEFLRDLADLSEEEDLKKRKITETESLEKSIILPSSSLANLLKTLSENQDPLNNNTLQECNTTLTEINIE